MRRNNIFFYNKQWPEQQHTFLGNRLSFLLLASPPRFLVREKTTRSRLSGPRRNIEFFDPDCLSHKHTHTKGGIPNNRQNNKVEIDHRAALQRKSPRPLSLSPFSSRRDIQPRGALWVVVRIDSCDGIRAFSPLSHRNQRRSLYSACR